MKHIRSIVLALAMTLGLVSLAYAQDSDTATSTTVTPVRPNPVERVLEKRDAIRTDVEAKRTALQAELEARKLERQATTSSSTKLDIEARRAELAARKVERTEDRAEFKEELAQRRVDHVTKIMLATIERLEKIAERIGSRIEKIKANGGDTSVAEEEVRLALVGLDEAEVLIRALSTLDLTSENAQDNFERIKIAAKEAKEAIKSAHAHLREAARSLGTISRPIDTATSTDES